MRRRIIRRRGSERRGMSLPRPRTNIKSSSKSSVQLPKWLSWKALAQYEAIRRLGQTNMLDSYMVQRIAFENGFYELVNVIDDHRAEFYSFIFKHYGEVLKEMKRRNIKIPKAKRVRVKFELEE